MYENVPFWFYLCKQNLKQKGKPLPYAALYLKFGAEAHSRAKQARFTAAYTNKKKMVTIPAMVFNLPANSTI